MPVRAAAHCLRAFPDFIALASASWLAFMCGETIEPRIFQ
jgi:hypothetical protein